jgi:hypothetical protein
MWKKKFFKNWASGMAQGVALSSSPSTAKKKLISQVTDPASK